MDRYEMKARIGEGTFGIVYRAKKKGDPGKSYAVKKLRQRFSSWKDVVIEREFEAIVRLMTHPTSDEGTKVADPFLCGHNRDYLVRVYEILREGDSFLYFVMEDMPGGSLHDYITEKSQRTKSPPLSLDAPVPLSDWNDNECQTPRTFDESETRSILFQAFRGLCHVHTVGLIHRDIKPENILLKGRTAKLADFSLTRSIPGKITHQQSGRWNRTNHGCWKTGDDWSSWNGADGAAATDYVGTRWYRAPELLRTDQTNACHRGIGYSEAIDVFSMGCVAAELYRCRPLFRGRDEAEQLALIEEMLRDGPMPPFARYGVTSKGLSEHEPERRRTNTSVANRLSDAVPSVYPRDIPFLVDLLRICPEERPTAGQILSHAYFQRQYYDSISVRDKNPTLSSVLRARRTRQYPVLEPPNPITNASPGVFGVHNHKRRRPLSVSSDTIDSPTTLWQKSSSAEISPRAADSVVTNSESGMGLRRFSKADGDNRISRTHALSPSLFWDSNDLVGPFLGVDEPPEAAIPTSSWKRQRQKLSPSQIFNID